MKIYHYNKETKHYVNTSDARKDPLDRNRYLIPAYATTIEPIFRSNKITVFDVNKNEWILNDIIERPQEPIETEEEKFIRIKTELLMKYKYKLSSTDWYAARYLKRGIPIPDEVKENDKTNGKIYDKIEAATKMSQIQKYISS